MEPRRNCRIRKSTAWAGLLCAGMLLFSFAAFSRADSGTPPPPTGPGAAGKGIDVGVQHNYKEEKSVNRSRLLSGALSSPPLSTAQLPTRVSVIAHWFNDFGLDFTRAGGGAICWYDWRWNHRDAGSNGFAPYDPARHPLLGWYRGDDRKALDWICYWLREYGVSAVNLVSTEGLDTGKWSSSTDRHFWVYQLFHNVPNFKGLQYILSGSNSGSPSDIERSWNKLVDFYLEHPTFYRVKVGRKSYPLIFCFETEKIRGAFDGYGGSAPKTLAFYRSIAERFKAAGFDGVAILARHANATHYKANGAPIIQHLDQATLERNDVYFLRASYNFEWTSTSEKNYRHLVENYGFAQLDQMRRERTVGNVVTSAVSKPPHPSKWNFPGGSPDLFYQWVVKAVQQMERYDMPRMLTVYNVSEWAEGGPGLVPNMKDGFAYLEALKKGVSGPASGPQIRR